MALKFPDSADSADLAAAGYSQVIILGGGNDTAGTSTTATADLLLVAGGGGGGARKGAGGGGAGALLEGTMSLTSGTTYQLQIGAGGMGGYSNGTVSGAAGLYQGVPGDDTKFGISGSEAHAIGGGAGKLGNGNTGGSGSGGGRSSGTGGTASNSGGNVPSGFTYYGNNGGAGANSEAYGGGGGGGAGTAGSNGSTTSGTGVGGDGRLISWITATAAGSSELNVGEVISNNVYFAGGGGGSSGFAAGGDGGGGDGSGSNSHGSNGISHTGSGGGGGGTNSTYYGGAGGTGVVVVKLRGVANYTIGSDLTSSNITASTYSDGTDSWVAFKCTTATSGSGSSNTGGTTGTGTWTPTISVSISIPAPSTTWTIPEGVDSFSIMAIGAGGAAGYSDSSAAGGGGGGGGLAYLNNIAVTQGDQSVQSITVSGGQLGTGADSNGVDGGDATDLTVTMNLSTDPVVDLSGYNLNPYGQDSHIDSFGTILFIGANRAYDSDIFDSYPTLNLNFDDSNSSTADQFVYVQPTGPFGAGAPSSIDVFGNQKLFEIQADANYTYIQSLAENDPNTTNRWGYNNTTTQYSADSLLARNVDWTGRNALDSSQYYDSDIVDTFFLQNTWPEMYKSSVLGTIDSIGEGTGLFTTFLISSNALTAQFNALPGQSPYVDSNGQIIISGTGDPFDFNGFGPQDLNQILIIKNLTP